MPHPHAPMPELKKKPEVFELLYGAWQPEVKTEEVSIWEAAGRTTAEDIYAKYNQPVVRASRMDGVAVWAERFAAGMPDTSQWQPGIDYVRADTGDDFDDAFDAVIQIEKVRILENGGLKFADGVVIRKGMNIAPAGSNMKEGMLLVPAGTKLRAQDLSLIVTGGYDTVRAAKKPVISFVPTGSELVAAGADLQRGQNFDSNSIMIKTLLTEMGAEVVLHPIIRDDQDQIAQALDELLPVSDLVILNAGTSKGGEDLCVQYLASHGTMLFHGAAAVPGRPMSITMLDGKPVLNMSGPSFAAFYTCKWLLAPIIARMLGSAERTADRTITAILAEDLETPPFLSLIVPLQFTPGEDGTLLARRIVTMGRGARPQSEALQADAWYVSSYGEAKHAAGEQIEVYPAR